MALRLIEVFLLQEQERRLQEVIGERSGLHIWQQRLSETEVLVRILLSAGESEAVLDVLEKHFSTVDGFRIILLPVEATVPRPESPEEKVSEQAKSVPESVSETQVARISCEELYADITDSTKLTRIFVAMILLSSIVAAIGILRKCGLYNRRDGHRALAWSQRCLSSCYHPSILFFVFSVIFSYRKDTRATFKS